MLLPQASTGLERVLRKALGVADRDKRLARLLDVALEACGVERAFLLLATAGADDALRPAACSSARGDGDGRPSRTAARRALSGVAVAGAVESESVRALALRSILSVPVPLDPPARAALLVDSRRGLARPIGELQRTLESVGALVALSLRVPDEDGFPSPAHRAMRDWIRRVAPTDLPVLVIGESGSGKEGVSRTVHRLSRRAEGPFLALNCAALTETLLEAELFGVIRGAYTGADRDRPGLFARADGGTLFLDEVADMSAPMQAKLLRAIEERRVRPVGGGEEREVDVRIVAASHRDLAREVARGRFRADLYHRLAVLRVEVPPLRSRLEDLPALLAGLAPRLLAETGNGPPRLTAAAWRRLCAHRWPGNVRELHAVLARALLRAEGGRIGVEHLDPPGAPSAGPAEGEADEPALERGMIEVALASAEGSLTAAAARIGWSRQKLYRRMKALRLSRSGWATRSSESSTFQ